MEGPSIFLAVEWLAPFIGKKIESVDGIKLLKAILKKKSQTLCWIKAFFQV
ncbi:MAG TPA: hypothetical protein VGP47_03455 [Parachlamydiaceae bacterium]|nr:hypothetical protein [Parachlamydiaceae bacterium]